MYRAALTEGVHKSYINQKIHFLITLITERLMLCKAPKIALKFAIQIKWYIIT